MKKNKRAMSNLIRMLIILVVLAVGIGVYFWLFSGDTGSLINTGTNAGSSISQPPALPN